MGELGRQAMLLPLLLLVSAASIKADRPWPNCPAGEEGEGEGEAGEGEGSKKSEPAEPLRTFGIGGRNNRTFMLNGEPITLMSGSMHYWRVQPQQWEYRLWTMREMGLNAIDTYVPWSLHQPTPRARFITSGALDLVAFVKEAHRQGLMVIFRPGPYICSELDLGGLPPWLLSTEGVRLRSSKGPFLEAVQKYFDWLLPLVAPLQWGRGGPIIAFQVENEFGHIGGDPKYMEALRDMMLSGGVTEMLVTSDAAVPRMLKGGAVPGALRTINFGPPIGAEAGPSLELLRKLQPRAPMMVMELWVGWFDHWGEQHHTVPVPKAVEAVADVLDEGASFNLYMYHGGTNFGMTNGANFFDAFHPTTTSYDYDAPLSEGGGITPKWRALQKLLKHYQKRAGFHLLPKRPPPPPAPNATEYGAVWMEEALPLLDCPAAFPQKVTALDPLPMERLPVGDGGGQGLGLLLYRTRLRRRDPTSGRAAVQLRGMHDRAQVFVAPAEAHSPGERKAAGATTDPNARFKISIPAAPAGDYVPMGAAGGGWLEVLVENMGHVNMGDFRRLGELKGLTGGVEVEGGLTEEPWDMHPLDFSGAYTARLLGAACWVCMQGAGGEDGAGNKVQAEPLPRMGGQPVFFKGQLDVEGDIGDTWLDLTGFRKGLAFVNGVNLGRYWQDKGPQRRLYVPAPVLRQGANRVLLLELHGPAALDRAVARQVTFVKEPKFTV